MKKKSPDMMKWCSAKQHQQYTTVQGVQIHQTLPVSVSCIEDYEGKIGTVSITVYMERPFLQRGWYIILTMSN